MSGECRSTHMRAFVKPLRQVEERGESGGCSVMWGVWRGRYEAGGGEQRERGHATKGQGAQGRAVWFEEFVDSELGYVAGPVCEAERFDD